jgi:hypothetical protein
MKIHHIYIWLSYIHHIYIYQFSVQIQWQTPRACFTQSRANTQLTGSHRPQPHAMPPTVVSAVSRCLQMCQDVSSMYVCMYWWMYACMYVCMYMCMCMSMSMYMYMYTCKCIYIYKLNMWVHVYVYTIIIVCLNAMNWHQWSSLGIVKSMKYPLKHVLVALHCPAGIAMAVT